MIAALLIAGAALELAGLWLVAYDVVDARRHRAELSRQHQLVQIGAAIEHDRAVGIPTVIGGATTEPEPPPLDERVATLETQFERLRDRLDQEAERHVEAHRELNDQAAAMVAEARRETFDLEQKLRPTIGVVAAGNIMRRGIGVALFASGLVVQTIANIVAL